MTIALITSPGGVFTRIGRMGGLLNSLNTYRLTTIKTAIDLIEDQFEATDQEQITNLYPSWASYEATGDALAGYMRSLAQQVLMDMVKDDQKLVDVTLAGAVAELIRQMDASSDSIEKPTVSVAVAVGGSNNGTGVCIASVLNKRGVILDYPFAETIRVRCTLDSQAASGGATLGKEAFRALGQRSVTDFTSQDWPIGSGCDVALSALSADDDASQTTNLLVGGDMEAFTANTPDNWTVDTGTPGTQILKTTANPYRGSAGLEYVGHATAASIYQKFNTAGQSTAKLSPNTVYGFNAWIKTSGSPAAGGLSFSLTDSTGTVITDDAATDNTITRSLSASPPTSWTAVNGFFRTPKALPSEARLRVKLSTALSAGTSVYIDDLVLTPATQLYAGGPWVAIFSGATKFIQGATVNQADIFTITVSNNNASKWALILERFFDLRSLDLQFPSVTGAAETVLDSLVA